MKALRIHLTQSSANYRREEVIENKMTYPLPPFSTVIGALHYICGFKEYKDMDISIQGEYKSLNKEPYTDYCFLNSTQDDRGILVKMANPSLLSTGYRVVGRALKSQGNSFRNDITVATENKELMQEYRGLKDLNDEISSFKKERYNVCMNQIKRRKKALSVKKKTLDRDDSRYEIVIQREAEIKQMENEMKERMTEFEWENYTKPNSMFRTLTTSLKFYEILTDIELYIHVRSDDEVLEKIKENIFEWKSLGRSEDFVNILEAEIINLKLPDGEYESSYHAYLDANAVESPNDDSGVYVDGKIYISHKDKKAKVRGVKYYINKKYEKVHGKRIFDKKKVLYTSCYDVDEETENVYIDAMDEKSLIVNFI